CEQFVPLARPVGERNGELVVASMRLAAMLRRDRRGVGLERLLDVDEMQWRLSADVPVTDEISEHPGLIRRVGLRVAEPAELPGLRHPVARTQFARGLPTLVGHHAVVRRGPERRAAAQTEPDHVLLALVE